MKKFNKFCDAVGRYGAACSLMVSVMVTSLVIFSIVTDKTVSFDKDGITIS